MGANDDAVKPQLELAGWGRRFEALRNDVGLDKWCEKVGSNRNSWSKYEKEIQAPGLDLLLRLHERLGISLDELITGKKPFVLDVEMLIRAYAVAKAFSDDAVARGLPEFGSSQMVGLMLDYCQDAGKREQMERWMAEKTVQVRGMPQFRQNSA